MIDTSVLVTIEIINNDADYKAKPVLLISRGFSTNADIALRELIVDLDICSKYYVLVPKYSDTVRMRQKAATSIKKVNLELSKKEEYFLYMDCATCLSKSMATLQISDITMIGLSAGASVIMCLIPMLFANDVNVTTLHIFAPDPLPDTATKIHVATSIYWQLNDAIIPLYPNCISVIKWLDQVFKVMIVVPGDKHDFHKKTLSDILYITCSA